MAYLYHFAILFEALFILTVIDTGTRVARFIVQEQLGKVQPSWGETSSMTSTLVSTAIVVLGWSTLIWSGSIATVWPLFGISNQLLAAIALVVGTVYISRVVPKAKFWKRAWVTLLPLSFVAVVTLTAGWQSIFDNYLPLVAHGQVFLGVGNALATAIMMSCLVIMLALGAKKLDR